MDGTYMETNDNRIAFIDYGALPPSRCASCGPNCFCDGSIGGADADVV